MSDFDLEASLVELQEEIDAAKSMVRWTPPPGVYDCLLEKVVVHFQEKDGTRYPCYKPFFKILDAEDLEKTSFTRFFSLAPAKSRKFALLELCEVARAANDGEDVANPSAAIAKLVAAGDKGDVVINVHIIEEPGNTTDSDGKPVVYTRFQYTAVSAAVA